MFTGGSKKVVEKLEHVQRSAVRGPRVSDQRGGVEGAGFFSFGDKETKVEGEWCGVPSCLGEHYKANGFKLHRKWILVLANTRTIGAHKLQFERCSLDVRKIFLAALEEAANVAVKSVLKDFQTWLEEATPGLI